MESSRPDLVSRVTQLKGLQWRGGVGIGWNWGLPCFPGLSPSWPENLQKVGFLKPSQPSLQSCPLLAPPLTRAIRLTYLSLAKVACPWSAHLTGGNMPRPQNHRTRALSHRHLPGNHFHHVGSGPTQLHSARLGRGQACTFWLLLRKQMQHGGAPGTGKGTCGNRQALRKTCNTLHTCSIPVPRDMQHCSLH